MSSYVVSVGPEHVSCTVFESFPQLILFWIFCMPAHPLVNGNSCILWLTPNNEQCSVWLYRVKHWLIEFVCWLFLQFFVVSDWLFGYTCRKCIFLIPYYNTENSCAMMLSCATIHLFLYLQLAYKVGFLGWGKEPVRSYANDFQSDTKYCPTTSVLRE